MVEARRGKWSTTSTEDWIKLYDINTLSIVRMVQRFLPHLPDNGRIINLGTIGSTRPNNVMPHYYAAKGALATLTVSLSKEVGPRGITVNLVSPGLNPHTRRLNLRTWRGPKKKAGVTRSRKRRRRSRKTTFQTRLAGLRHDGKYQALCCFSQANWRHL